MRAYGPDLYTDEELVEEIKLYLKAKRDAALGGSDIVVIAGEGRRLEFAPKNFGQIDLALREMGWEARQRGLDIGGEAGALLVEIG
jgi:hypothetical protein